MTKEEQVVSLLFQVANVGLHRRRGGLRRDRVTSVISTGPATCTTIECSYGCSPCLFEKVRPRFPERKPRRATGLSVMFLATFNIDFDALQYARRLPMPANPTYREA